MPVIAVGGDALVALFGRGLQPDHNGLLTDVEVAEAADLLVLVGLHGADLEFPDQQHLAQPFLQLFGGRVGAVGQRPTPTGGGA